MMKNYPTNMTRKEFWTLAYLSALQRVDAKSASSEADEALSICEQKWKNRLAKMKAIHWHDECVGSNNPSDQDEWEWEIRGQ